MCERGMCARCVCVCEVCEVCDVCDTCVKRRRYVYSAMVGGVCETRVHNERKDVCIGCVQRMCVTKEGMDTANKKR